MLYLVKSELKEGGYPLPAEEWLKKEREIRFH
jgi:hypothetical protein